MLLMLALIASSAGQLLVVNYNASQACKGAPQKITYQKLTTCTPFSNCPGSEPYGAQNITCSPTDADLIAIINAQGSGKGVTIQYSDDACTMPVNASADYTAPVGGNPNIGKCQFATLGLRQAVLATPITSLLPGGTAADPGAYSGSAEVSALGALVACVMASLVA